MSCDADRITAYVDGELDEVRAQLTEEHLLACTACREQADAERALRRRLRALEPPVARPELEAILRRRGRPAARRWRWALPLAAGLAAVLLWVRGAPPFVAWELAWDHAHCFDKPTLPAQVWSSDPDQVAAWLAERGTRPPSLPDEAHGLPLVGVRRCPLMDRGVGHVYYASREGRLSLYVVPGSVRLEDGLRTQSQGRTVHLLRVGGSVVGLVSEDADAVDAFARALTTTMARAGAP